MAATFVQQVMDRLAEAQALSEGGQTKQATEILQEQVESLAVLVRSLDHRLAKLETAGPGSLTGL